MYNDGTQNTQSQPYQQAEMPHQIGMLPSTQMYQPGLQHPGIAFQGGLQPTIHYQQPGMPMHGAQVVTPLGQPTTEYQQCGMNLQSGLQPAIQYQQSGMNICSQGSVQPTGQLHQPVTQTGFQYPQAQPVLQYQQTPVYIEKKQAVVPQQTVGITTSSNTVVPEGGKGVNSDGMLFGAWQAGLCDCCSNMIPNCCMVSCLPFVSIAQVSHRIGKGSYSSVLLFFFLIYASQSALQFLFRVRMEDRDCVRNYYGNLDCDIHIPAHVWILMYVLQLIVVLFLCQLRGQVRRIFRIPGSVVYDFICSLCCGCCSLAQMATHTKSYQPGSCNFGPEKRLENYVV